MAVNEKELRKKKEKLKKEITSVNKNSYKTIKSLEKKIDVINKKLGLPFEYTEAVAK